MNRFINRLLSLILVCYCVLLPGCSRPTWDQQIIGTWEGKDEVGVTQVKTFKPDGKFTYKTNGITIEGYWKVVNSEKHWIRHWASSFSEKDAVDLEMTIEGDSLTQRKILNDYTLHFSRIPDEE